MPQRQITSGEQWLNYLCTAIHSTQRESERGGRQQQNASKCWTCRLKSQPSNMALECWHAALQRWCSPTFILSAPIIVHTPHTHTHSLSLSHTLTLGCVCAPSSRLGLCTLCTPLSNNNFQSSIKHYGAWFLAPVECRLLIKMHDFDWLLSLSCSLHLGSSAATALINYAEVNKMCFLSLWTLLFNSEKNWGIQLKKIMQ
jgi:hypothetical protein